MKYLLATSYIIKKNKIKVIKTALQYRMPCELYQKLWQAVRQLGTTFTYLRQVVPDNTKLVPRYFGVIACETTTIFYYFSIVLNPLAPQVAVLFEAGQDNQ